MYCVVATRVLLSLKVEQLTWCCPWAASSVKPCNLGSRPTWEEPGEGTPVTAFLAPANLFSCHWPLCFLHSLLPPTSGSSHVLFPVPGTPTLYLIGSELSFRSRFNCHFITKLPGPPGLNSSWHIGSESEGLGLNPAVELSRPLFSHL